jgi:hypothetical protein
MADESLSGAPLQQLRHSAEWAQKFKRGTMRFARPRHAQDVLDYTDALQQERELEQAQLLTRSKVAQDFFFRSKKADLDQEAHAAALEERAQRMAHAEEMFPLKKQLAQEQLDLATVRERIATNAELRRIRDEKRQLEHADALDSTIEEFRALGFRPGTPEYADRVEGALQKFIFAPDEMRKAAREGAKISAEFLPVTQTTTIDTQTASDPAYPSVTTTKTTTTEKVAPDTLKARTPLSGSDFLKNLGLAPKPAVTP